MAVDDIVEWLPHDGSIKLEHKGRRAFFRPGKKVMATINGKPDGEQWELPTAGLVLDVDGSRVQVLFRMV
jgi:hypothetical protein